MLHKLSKSHDYFFLNWYILMFSGDIVQLLRGFVSLLNWRKEMDAILKEAGTSMLVSDTLSLSCKKVASSLSRRHPTFREYNQ